MDAASSPFFESSEMLAILEEAWRLCSLANSNAQRSFVAKQLGEVGYLAFSGVQDIDGSDPSCGTLVALGECGCEDLFSPLKYDGGVDGEETVKVDAGFLRLFLKFYWRQDFRNQSWELLGKVKIIILTGHSFGATTASLTALWLLSHLQPVASPIPVLCLTFGTPLLGNKSLSRAILRQSWGSCFCNVVSMLDVMPKLFFAPLDSLFTQLCWLIPFWQLTMALPSLDSPDFQQLVGELRKRNYNEFFSNIKNCVKDAAQSGGGAKNSLFWPLGSYLFYSEETEICLDNATSVVKMMHHGLETVSPASSFEDHLKCFQDHLKYPDYTGLFCLRKRFERERERAREIEREKDQLAVEKAELAVEKAELAVERAQLAEERDQLAVERAQLAEGRAQLDVKRAQLAEKKATRKADKIAAAEARLSARRAASEKASAEARKQAKWAALDREKAEFCHRARRAACEELNAEVRERAEQVAVQKAQAVANLRAERAVLDEARDRAEWAVQRAQAEARKSKSAERRRVELERHQRTQERAAKAIADINQRELQTQKEQEEKRRIGETLDVEIKRWATDKKGNLRVLLYNLQYVLWPECGWKPVSWMDLISAASVKKLYKKATLCVHPDKVQQKGANLKQQYIAEKVFELLKEAWNKFFSEELV